MRFRELKSDEEFYGCGSGTSKVSPTLAYISDRGTSEGLKGSHETFLVVVSHGCLEKCLLKVEGKWEATVGFEIGVPDVVASDAKGGGRVASGISSTLSLTESKNSVSL